MSAREARKPRREGLEAHPLVSAVVKGSRRSTRVRVIRGYLGEEGEDGTVPVYLDVELRRSVDVPADEIAHVERPWRGGDPLAPDLVWVDEETKIRHRGSWAAPEDPTTMATGEEGGDPTTMATGEESAGFRDPLELVVNPFGGY